jgi:hypothetical protein
MSMMFAIGSLRVGLVGGEVGESLQRIGLPVSKPEPNLAFLAEQCRTKPERDHQALSGVGRWHRRCRPAVPRAVMKSARAPRQRGPRHSCGDGGPVLEELHQSARELVVTSKAAKCNRSWTGVRMPGLMLAVEGIGARPWRLRRSGPPRFPNANPPAAPAASPARPAPAAEQPSPGDRGRLPMWPWRGRGRGSFSLCWLFADVRSVDCTLTGSPPDSPPSSLANGGEAPSGEHSRELLQSAKRTTRHSASRCHLSGSDSQTTAAASLDSRSPRGRSLRPTAP